MFDEAYINAIKHMVDKARKKIGNYEPEVVIENMVPESQRNELENPQPLTDSEYRRILKELKSE